MYPTGLVLVVDGLQPKKDLVFHVLYSSGYTAEHPRSLHLFYERLKVIIYKREFHEIK